MSSPAVLDDSYSVKVHSLIMKRCTTLDGLQSRQAAVVTATGRLEQALADINTEILALRGNALACQ
jgi:hypothetical protein